MPRFDQESAAAGFEVQQLVLDWGRELDINDGTGIAALLTADVEYLLGGKPFVGHDAVTAFYAARRERIKTEQKDGVRTQRHAISNLRVAFDGTAKAEVSFLVVNYSAAGRPPVMDLVGPTIVADARMECRLEADGTWRISLFDSQPVFVGNDPFLNANVMKK